MVYKRPVLSLMARAVGYLSRREYSRTELARKLNQAVLLRSRNQTVGNPHPPVESFEMLADNTSVEESVQGAAESIEREIDRVLDVLEEKGLLSTERFAQSVAHRKASRLGAARIMQELRGHDVQPALLSEINSQLKASEFMRAQAIWRKKFAGLPTDRDAMAKQIRFLITRGFSTAVAMKVVHGRDADEG